MRPVGSDDGVLGPQSRHNAGVHGLLSRAEVAETSDGFFFVEIGGGCLQSPDGDHLLVELEGLVPGEGGGGWWTLIQSVQLVVGEVKGCLLDLSLAVMSGWEGEGFTRGKL